ALEGAIQAAEQTARSHDSGHADLFGGLFVEADADVYANHRSAKEVTLKERLRGEKETLGLYLTGHPIDEYEGEIRRFARQRIVDLKPSRETQTIAGLIIALRVMKNKKGDKMGFITLDDRSGRIEASLFADSFQAAQSLLQTDAMVVVEGEVSTDDFSGGLRLRAKRVMSLEEARTGLAESLRLNLRAEALKGDRLRWLGELCKKHRGACPITLDYTGQEAKAVLQFGEAWRIDPADSLIQALRARSIKVGRLSDQPAGLLAVDPRRMPMNPNFLDFEQPIADLQAKIEELRLVGNDNSLNIGDEISRLQEKSNTLTESIFGNLTSWQIARMARHPRRPYTLDYIQHIFTEFDELHGDRHFSDDAAIVGGIARLDEQPVMVIGHQKGREVREKVRRNFGMPRPEGYRKACRLMEMAERFKMPILTFIDTPGAYPGIDAEERNQSEAIAWNLRVMARLKTPIIATVIGEGGSGGALAIGVCDQLNMLQYSTYAVISPEGCASILWKTAEKAP
nr:acetyl-coenzyme A carboxylase carboxyl transferase subunit alpha, chloroplastic [Tanacetum cinerariifolium]